MCDCGEAYIRREDEHVCMYPSKEEDYRVTERRDSVLNKISIKENKENQEEEEETSFLVPSQHTGNDPAARSKGR